MSLLGWVKRAWAAMDYVPDCPTCKGTGLPPPDAPWRSVTTYWMGALVRVCWQCHGAGKV